VDARAGVTSPGDGDQNPFFERYQRHRLLRAQDKPLSSSHVLAPVACESLVQNGWQEKTAWLFSIRPVILDLPKVAAGLPKHLSAKEADTDHCSTDPERPICIANRAILESSTHADPSQGNVGLNCTTLTLSVERDGSSGKERRNTGVIPIGKRALQWIPRLTRKRAAAAAGYMQRSTLFLVQRRHGFRT